MTRKEKATKRRPRKNEENIKENIDNTQRTILDS